MKVHHHQLVQTMSATSWAALVLTAGSAIAEAPRPVLETVFPTGGTVGRSVEVEISGSALDEVTTLYCTHRGVRCTRVEEASNRFRLSIPPEALPGFYDLWAVTKHGLSSPRPFRIGHRPEQLEVEPNESAASAQKASNGTVVNGRIEKGGDQDHFRFSARRGQRVVIECWAERIDSRLRAVLEVFSADGRRLAVNRGYFGIDPLIDFSAPSDGDYIVRLHDLVFAGSAEHYYRLDIDSGPRVAFTVPNVVQRGKPARLTLFGWNLSAAGNAAVSSVDKAEHQAEGTARDMPGFERFEVELPVQMVDSSWPLPIRLSPAQVVFEGLPYHFPSSNAVIAIGVTDVPVSRDREDNHSPERAQPIAFPCELSGQLAAGDEQDWYVLEAKRGEVLYFELLAARIGSPVDLELNVLDATGRQELAKFSDELKNVGAPTLPSSHSDPSGRWRVPEDGRYLLVVRNLTGSTTWDPRRGYRLSVRREEPDLQVALAPHHTGPAGINVAAGGRTVLDLIAFRRRGLAGPIRVAASELPDGIECPDVWLGPGVDRGTMVLSADPKLSPTINELKLAAFSKSGQSHEVRGGVVVRTGLSNGWGRLTSSIPFGVAGEAPLRITADGHEPRDHHLYGELQVRHAPGGILDVAVYVDRRETEHQAALKIRGIGLPDMVRNQTAVIPPGEDKGYVSFYLPPSLPVGPYTFAIQAETTVPAASGDKSEAVTVYSNPVNFEVHTPAFRLEVDPLAPRRIRRGEVVQVNYSARRINGFIGKIHTELASPGTITKVVGLRGRGVSFVGQTETGVVQIIANDDAPLGQQPFLRLYGIGTLEDEALFHGSCFLQLEVVE